VWWRHSHRRRAIVVVSRAELDTRQLDLEDQDRVRRDPRGRAGGAVRQLRRNHQDALAALAHADQALVPAADHLAGTERDAEGLGALDVRVEEIARLAVGLEPAAVLDACRVAGGDGLMHHNQ